MDARIIKTLVRKDIWRHRSDRGGLALVAMLIVAALMVGIFGRNNVTTSTAASGVIGGAHHCIINYDQNDPYSLLWTNALRFRIPDELKQAVAFRRFENNDQDSEGNFVYRTGIAAIQIRRQGDGSYKIWTWYPAGTDSSAIAPYEDWFFRESRAFMIERAEKALGKPLLTARPDDDFWIWRQLHETLRLRFELASVGATPEQAAKIRVPELTFERSGLGGASLNVSSLIVTALVMFGIFLSCVYILPSMVCEERERGMLLAQALSPASPGEILFAKFLFYPTFGVGLAALLSGLYDVKILMQPFFWLSLLVIAVGSFGIGMTIACIARTQRSASMGTLTYTMGVGMFLVICQQYNIPFVMYLSLEYYIPRLLHAAIGQTVQRAEWFDLLRAVPVAIIWNMMAMRQFRKRGWQ